jgi:RimJ/RimL family protein N-acetyltransferase
MEVRLATSEDVFKVSQLYFDTYQGTYPDLMMKDFTLIKDFINKSGNFWFVTEDQDKIIASVLIVYDEENLLAKAYGAVVRPECRGKHVMEHLLFHGIQFVREHTAGVDIVYSTTRTVNEAAQSLTEKLSFKKLGLLPNAHKTQDYETHGVAALIYQSAFDKRFTNYSMHEELKPLVDIVSEEIPLVATMATISPLQSSRQLIAPPDLEMIESKLFVNYRYDYLKNNHALEFEFFPFHKPNVLILSPDQSIEIFCYLNVTDGYSVIIGGKVADNINYTELLKKINSMLRDHGARYVEMIIRADKPKILESVMKAKFIPCAFFPAFQLINNVRYDFFVLSRTFEVFDFQNVKLKGVNQKFLEFYYNHWKKLSLSPKLLDL